MDCPNSWEANCGCNSQTFALLTTCSHGFMEGSDSPPSHRGFLEQVLLGKLGLFHWKPPVQIQNSITLPPFKSGIRIEGHEKWRYQKLPAAEKMDKGLRFFSVWTEATSTGISFWVQISLYQKYVKCQGWK